MTSNVLRTIPILLFFLYHVCYADNVYSEPWIMSISVIRKQCDSVVCKYVVKIDGGEFLGHYSWKLTPKEAVKGSKCDVIYPNYDLQVINTTQWLSHMEITLPKNDNKIFFCHYYSEKKNTPFGGYWIHQGSYVYINPQSGSSGARMSKTLNPMSNEIQSTMQQTLNTDLRSFSLSHDTDVNYNPPIPSLNGLEKQQIEVRMKDGYVPLTDRRKRQVQIADFTTVKADLFPIKIEGVRVENSAKEPKTIDNNVPSLLAGSAATLRLFGEGLTARTVIAFTHDALAYGQPCKFILKGEYMVTKDSLTPKSVLIELVAPQSPPGSKLYICAKNMKFGIDDPSRDEEKYYHQGIEPWTVLATHNSLLPIWVTLVMVSVCLMFSALFSGLNLGLMSLDRTELKIISNTGTETERKYARAIMPVRDHGNYLLCSILLGNVAVNSTFTIMLDELTSGLFAVIFSTLAIVLLGEITPQAICSRHGLMVGAKTIMVTKAVMAVTAPLAYPVSKILDYLLGEEIGSVYNRERLKELVKVTTDMNDLDRDEVNIISGALELRKKTVSHVMTKLEDVFMLPITAVLDFETMSEIIKSGYSRIPVYETHRTNIVTVLFIKDLAFVDPDDNTPLRTLCQYYQNVCNFVFEDVTLDVMFKQFKDGHKGHMAFVHRINNEGEGDPFYETIGLVTLEDVIEEMIQSEIVDETDVFTDNRTKKRRNRPLNKLQDFTAFAEKHENQRIHISPQLTLATHQFLSTSVDAFRSDMVSETVLRRLLQQDVFHQIKLKGKTKKDSSTFVFQQGKPVDYFVLILEGRVEVTVGRENLVFEAGPFTYFGVQALIQNVGVAESPTPSAMGSLQNLNMDSLLRHTFVPDYSVRAVTELYYLTVKRSLYLAAKRATLMEKGALSKGATAEQFDTEVDKTRNIIELMQVPNVSFDNKQYGMESSGMQMESIYGSENIGTDSKKKQTFHRDSSLIMFHNINGNSHISSEENIKLTQYNNPIRSNNNIFQSVTKTRSGTKPCCSYSRISNGTLSVTRSKNEIPNTEKRLNTVATSIGRKLNRSASKSFSDSLSSEELIQCNHRFNYKERGSNFNNEPGCSKTPDEQEYQNYLREDNIMIMLAKILSLLEKRNFI